MANREGALCRFVRPEIVVEVRGSDLLSTDASDRPIRRMGLEYDAERGWAPTGEAPTAVLLHPVFLRERTDKIVDEGDVGFHQLLRHVVVETEASAKARQAAETVARGVFTKTTKGKVAVRKYVIIDGHDPKGDHRPPWMAFFTDYSLGRKEPLQTSLVTGSSQEGVHDEVRSWLAENIKRGWSEVEGARVGPDLAR